jgi:hypothetical protein
MLTARVKMKILAVLVIENGNLSLTRYFYLVHVGLPSEIDISQHHAGSWRSVSRRVILDSAMHSLNQRFVAREPA